MPASTVKRQSSKADLGKLRGEKDCSLFAISGYSRPCTTVLTKQHNSTTWRPRGLSKWIISGVISTPKWGYPNYNPTYSRLTKSPVPPSRILKHEDVEGSGGFRLPELPLRSSVWTSTLDGSGFRVLGFRVLGFWGLGFRALSRQGTLVVGVFKLVQDFLYQRYMKRGHTGVLVECIMLSSCRKFVSVCLGSYCGETSNTNLAASLNSEFSLRPFAGFSFEPRTCRGLHRRHRRSLHSQVYWGSERVASNVWIRKGPSKIMPHKHRNQTLNPKTPPKNTFKTDRSLARKPAGPNRDEYPAGLTAQCLADVGAGRAWQDHLGVLSFLPEGALCSYAVSG